ncbi:MAG: TetR/AcrR family transcriptional regulator [Oscillospiraceae bacterium]|nr:TetR/AcrR family transcriptional regulator [Oscillospiraceae bacterium]
MRRDVIRTKKRIESAYYELCLKKGVQRITVNDILAEADVSRGTFYAHYRDIQDLSEHLENYIAETWRDILSEATLAQLMEDPRQQVRRMLTHMLERREEYRALIQRGGNTRLFNKLKALLTQALAEKQEHHTDREAIVIACVAGAILDSCVCWLLSDEPDQELLIDTVSAFLSGGLQKIYGGQ